MALALPAQATPTAQHRSAAAHKPPKPYSGPPLQGDIVPGRTPAGGLRQHAAGKTKVTKVLVILGYWDKHDSTTPGKAKSVVITQANTWYRRASYGHQGLTGTATKWLKIPRQTCGALNSDVIKAARTAADKAHYHSSNYDRFVLYEPCTPSNGSIGVGNLPGNQIVLVKGGLTLATAVHEQGHNYGLGHANELICKKGSSRATYQPGTSCQTHVYEDFSSDMSSQWNGKYADDFTAPQKNALGWLSGHVASVPSSKNSATVTLSRFESSTGTQAIKISGSSGRTYWVEYRTTTGNDEHLPAAYRGVLIHLSRPDTGKANKAAKLSQSLLLPTLAPDPSVLGFNGDAGPAYLPPTASWTTPEGIRITLTAQTAGSAHISISRGTHAGAPSAVAGPSATALDTSASVSFHRATDGGTPIRNYTVTGTATGGATRTATVTDLAGHTTLHTTVTGLTNNKNYTFKVQANSESGKSTGSASGAVMPMALPPTVHTSTIPTTVNGSLTVQANGIPNAVTQSKITKLALLVDGKSVAHVAAAQGSLTWDTGEAPGFAQDADYDITVTATDANGRSASTTVTTHLVQSTGPILSLTNFTPGPTNGAVNINGVAAPHSGHGVASVVATIVGSDGTFDQGANPGSLNPFVVEWDTLSGDFATGNHTITITATDSAGKVAVITRTVPLNNPSIQFTNPGGGSNVFGNYPFTGTVTNSSPVDGLVLDVLRGGSVVQTKQIDVDSGQTVSYSIAVNADNLPTSGSTAFTVRATDGTTRTATPSPHALTVFRRPPEVTFVSPTVNALVHDVVHFTGSATNYSATDGLSITVKQGSTVIVPATDLDIDAGATGSFDVSGNVSGVASDGSTSFTVVVTDKKATPQSSTPQVRALTMSHVPVITLDTPVLDSQVFGAAHFKGTLTNHSATPNLTLTVTSSAGGTITPTSQVVTVPARNVTPANFDITVDLDGVPAGVDQTFTITATDHDGLVGTKTRDLEVTHPNPAITVTAPLENALVVGSTHFTGTATNNSGTDGLTLDIEVNGDPFASEPLNIAAGATGSFDVTEDVSPLDIGSDAFAFTVTDANNRTSVEIDRDLGVDHPPVVTVTAPASDDQVSGIVHVTGTVSNGASDSGDPTVTAVIDDDHQGTDTPSAAPGATGNYDIALDLSDLLGDQVITVSATDASGVTTTTPVSVEVTVVAPADVELTTPADSDVITSGTVSFDGMVTNHAADAQPMTVHITDAADGINDDVPVADVGADSSVEWMQDVDVSGLPDGDVTFTITADYPFGGTSAPVTVTVDVDNP